VSLSAANFHIQYSASHKITNFRRRAGYGGKKEASETKKRSCLRSDRIDPPEIRLGKRHGTIQRSNARPRENPQLADGNKRESARPSFHEFQLNRTSAPPARFPGDPSLVHSLVPRADSSPLYNPILREHAGMWIAMAASIFIVISSNCVTTPSIKPTPRSRRTRSRAAKRERLGK